MARATPRVNGQGLLALDSDADGHILVDSERWYQWLDETKSFAFAGTAGPFTARRERSERGGWYWKAYRRRDGVLRTGYLGKSSDLTLERLEAMATDLAQTADGRPVGIAKKRKSEPSATTVAGYRIQLFGSFRVTVNGVAVPESVWRLRRSKTLIKLLALAPDHALHRGQVIDLLWPEAEGESPTSNLRHVVHLTRRVLDPTGDVEESPLQIRGDQIVLSPMSPLWIDVEAFEFATKTARRTGQLSHHDAAIQLYTGDLLPEDRYEDWAAARRLALRETYQKILLTAAELHDREGDYAEAVSLLQRVIASEPAHEHAHAELMRLYAQSGQRHQALRQYQQLQTSLRQEIDALPSPATQRLAADIQAARLSPRETASPPRVASSRPEAPRTNLPVPLTSFVGRERETAEIRTMLTGGPGARLLTLTGVGGCGKTRLALESADRLVPSFPDGVWLVELASLTDPGLVPGVIASTLGVSEDPHQPVVPSLVSALRSKSLLLVLDNCEHLTSACAHLAEKVLTNCPNVRILATSREALGLDGERTWGVPSLAVPNISRLPVVKTELVDNLRRVEAVQLFVERAATILPSFALTAENAHAIARICQRLDGLPLAIELAAARVKMLAVEQISDRLNESFRILSSASRTALPRHQTLRAAIDWSYALLSVPEQIVFHRLATFAGGWTLEAAESVCAAAIGSTIPDVLELLTHLADKSLVHVEEQPGGIRYRLLEPVRQFALEHLQTGDEFRTTLERHAAYFISVAEQSETALRGPGQLAWLDRLELELDNLRAAMGWMLEAQQYELQLRLAAGLDRFWQYHARITEGQTWLERGLADGETLTPVVRAKSLALLGWLLRFHGQFENAERSLNESLALFQEIGDQIRATRVVDSLGDLAYFSGNVDRALTLNEGNLASRRALGDHWGVAMSLTSLAWVVMTIGNDGRAIDLLEEALSLIRKIGDQRGVALVLYSRGLVALVQNDFSQAARTLSDSLAFFSDLGSKVDVALCLDALAAAGARVDPVHSATLFGASESLLVEVVGGRPQSIVWDHAILRHEAAARSRVDDRAWREAISLGRGLSADEALAAGLRMAKIILE